MPQTILALLALMLASVLTFNQQRLTTRAQTRMVTDEMELAASGLVSDVLEFAAARSFDESTTPEAIEAAQAVPQTAAPFRPVSAFGAPDRGPVGCDLLLPYRTPECDDVDDLDGLLDEPVEILLANGRRFPFNVAIRVSYVTGPESAVVSAVPTLHKRVLVSVRSQFVNGGRTTILSSPRVVSYDPIKAGKDHEDVFGPMGV